MQLLFFEVSDSNIIILNVLSQLSLKKQALLENCVLMYSKVLFNSKFKFLEKKCIR